MKEVWKNIEGYSDYKVSNFGNIKSYKKDADNGVILRLGKDDKTNKYVSVDLYNEYGVKTFYVHRLVANAFISNENKYPAVNHKNGIKYDNRAENLEWCTYSQNSNHSIYELYSDMYGNSKSLNDLKTHVNQRERGKRKKYQKKRKYNLITEEMDVDLSNPTNIVMLSKYGDVLATFENAEAASCFLNKSDFRSILNCCNKEPNYNSAHGYMWCYTSDIAEFNRFRNLKVIQSTEKGVKINEYDDVFQAAKINDFNFVSIINCLKNNCKTSYKCKWFFKSDYKECFTSKWKPIVKLSLCGEYICEYNSITDAAKDNNTSHISAIYQVCNKNRKTAGGFKWMYKDDYYNLIEKDSSNE